MLKGGCSDDGFEYFRGWLISRGRKVYEAVSGESFPMLDSAYPRLKGTRCESESNLRKQLPRLCRLVGERRSAEETLNLNLLCEGVLSIREGEHPRLMEDKLMVYLSGSKKNGDKGGKKGEQKPKK